MPMKSKKNKKQPISLFLYLSMNSIEKVETFTSNDQRSPKNVFTKRYRKKSIERTGIINF